MGGALGCERGRGPCGRARPVPPLRVGAGEEERGRGGAGREVGSGRGAAGGAGGR